ncbi:MAG: hypothetical protein LC687_01980, partial [Actinobacteria bacterium]|nr:hypothetical protein [Actinomycetota bacterium]
MNVQAVMITMAGREESANATAQQFCDIDVPVKIFTQPHEWAPGQESNNKNSARALQWFLDHTKGIDLLFLEDDLLIKPDRMRRALEAAMDKQEVSYFYMHDIPGRQDRYPSDKWLNKVFREHQYKPKTAWEQTKNIIIPEGLRKVPKSNVPVYGSQCIYFPRGYVKFLLDEMTYAVQYTKKVKAQPTRAMDSAVNDFRDNHRLDSYIYLPHPVQHLQNRT